MIKAEFLKHMLSDSKTHEAWFYYIGENSKCDQFIINNQDVKYYSDDALVIDTTTGLEIVNLSLVKKVIIK